MVVATRRVEEDDRGMAALLQHADAVGTERRGMRTQQGDIGQGYLIQSVVALYVDSLVEGLAHEDEVYAEATGEVEEF